MGSTKATLAAKKIVGKLVWTHFDLESTISELSNHPQINAIVSARWKYASPCPFRKYRGRDGYGCEASFRILVRARRRRHTATSSSHFRSTFLADNRYSKV